MDRTASREAEAGGILPAHHSFPLRRTRMSSPHCPSPKGPPPWSFLWPPQSLSSLWTCPSHGVEGLVTGGPSLWRRERRPLPRQSRCPGAALTTPLQELGLREGVSKEPVTRKKSLGKPSCAPATSSIIYTLLRNRPFCEGGKAEVWTAHFLPGAGPPGLRTVSCFCWSWSLAFLYLRPLERWDREGSALRYWGLAQRWRHLATQK